MINANNKIKTDKITGQAKMDDKNVCKPIWTVFIFLFSFLLLSAADGFADLPGPEYLTENQTECRFTDELVALADRLEHDPVKIFKWVYENIESPRPYYPDAVLWWIPFYKKSRLGAHATFIAGRGNHWDTSSLLITLLRISGVPARYARYENTGVVWVEAWLEQGNYRDGNGHYSTGQWVPMVPWFKEYHLEKGLDLFPEGQIPAGLDFDFDAYLKTEEGIRNQKPAHAFELYEQKLQEYLSQHHPGQTLDTIAYRERAKAFGLSILPPSLPKELSLAHPVVTFAQIPDSERVRFIFDVKKEDGDGNKENDVVLLSYTAVLPAIATKRLCLDFKTEAGGLKPVFKLDGVVVNGGQAGDPGLSSQEKFYLSFKGTDLPNEIDIPAKTAGTLIHIGLDVLAASEQNIFRLKQEIAGLDPALMDASSALEDREQFLGRIGMILSETFLMRKFKNFTRVDDVFHTKRQWESCPTFIYTDPVDVGEAKESKFWFHPRWRIDARTSHSIYKRIGDVFNYLSKTDPFYQLTRDLGMYAASYNEGMIFEDWQDTAGANTIKGLMIAYQDPNIEVRSLDETDIPMLENMRDNPGSDPEALDAATLNRWIEELSKGHTILAPLKRIRFSDDIVSSVSLVNRPDGGVAYLFGMDHGGAAAARVTYLTRIVNSKEIMDTLTEEQKTFFQIQLVNAKLTMVAENIRLCAELSPYGDPVNMVNGEFYTDEKPDFAIPAKGFDLSVIRNYKSQLIYNGIFGYGWTWNHAEQIIPQNNGDLLYYGNNSLPQKLTHNGDNTYQTAPGVTYTVVKEQSEYKVKFRNKTEYIFNADGFLIKKQDYYGNFLLFEYDPSHAGRIVKMTDALNRSLVFTYNLNGKVEKIEDFTGRFCSYGYNGDNLVSFTDLENNVTRFEYLENQVNPLNNHNMSKYILPNGDFQEIGYYGNDQVSWHKNKEGGMLNFFFSEINRYGETWNEEGYYRKVFFNENNDEIRVDNEDGTITQKEYDTYHNVIKSIDGNGNVTTYDYGPDPSKRLLHSKTDGKNQTTVYAYEDSHFPYKPSRITDPRGLITQLSYFPTGQLKSKTVGVGFVYDTDQRLTASPGAPGFTTTYEYDVNGNLIKITDPEGNTETLTYDTEGLHRIGFTDKNLNTIHFDYYKPGDHQPPGLLKEQKILSPLYPQGIKTQYQYNNYNLKTIVTDAESGITFQEYDINGQPTVLVRPDGSMIEKIYNPAIDIVRGGKVREIIDPMNNSTRFEYDRLGNITVKIDPSGNKTRLVYDGLNRVISKTDALGKTEYFTYDGNGNVLTHMDKEGHTTRFAYDVLGNLIESTDPEGNVTVYTYDENNNRVTVTDPNQVVTRFSYDGLNRLETKVIGSGSLDERTFRYRYDIFNRLVKEIKPEGNYASYQYDPAGNLTLKVFYDNTGLEMKREQRTYYADARNLLEKLVVDHGKGGLGAGTVYEYDRLGRKIRQTDGVGNPVLYEYDEVGNRVSTTTPLGVTQNRYDASGRRVVHIDAQNRETHYAYDANNNMVWTRDPAGHESEVFYDAINRKIGDLDALGNITTYDYDGNNNLISLTDPEGNTTHYKYDAAGRKTETIRPLGQRTTFRYDNGGRLTEIINGNGHKIAYTYNNLNKPLLVAYFNHADLTGAVKNTLMSYDANGNLTGYDDAVTAAVYTYDGLDRRTGTTVDYGGFSKTFSNAFPDHWTRTFTGPDNHTTRFEYDEAGRLTTADHDIAGRVQYTNFLWNKVQKKITPAFETDYSYDPNGRYTSIATRNHTQTVLLDRQYEYSPDNNLTGRTTEHGSYTYQYDAVSRLTRADVPAGQENEAYTYDGIGNRLTSLATTSTWQYNSNNELLNHDTTGYTYDDSGNTIVRTGDTPLVFFYDEANRMTRVEDEAGQTIATYYYDPFGQRLSKEVGGIKTYFLYSEQGLIGEYDATGQETRSYGYLPGTSDSVAPQYMKTGNEYYWYQNDRIGTPQQLVDSTGTLVWDARYTSFGKATPVIQTIVNNFRFPGQYFDQETGLHYNKNRYYDPDTGRYMRTDPIGIEGGINLYVYCLNNPLLYIDPEGLWGYGDADSDINSGFDDDGGPAHDSSSSHDPGPEHGWGAEHQPDYPKEEPERVGNITPCPETPPEGNPNWKKYEGDPDWFHCDYHGYIENRTPTPDNPSQECFYDEYGQLVDEDHEYKDCGGTPNDYPADDIINHIFKDRGGVVEHGAKSYIESRKKEFDDIQRGMEDEKRKILDEAWRKFRCP